MLKSLMVKSQKSKEKVKIVEKELEEDAGRIDIRVQTSEGDFFKHRFLGKIIKDGNVANFIYASTLYENFLYQLNNEKGSNFSKKKQTRKKVKCIA